MPKRKESLGVQCSKCCERFNPRTVRGAVHLASCKVYQGWVNYETWAVSLWIDNDQSTYRYWREVAEACKAEGAGRVLSAEENAVYLLANALKREIENDAPDLGASPYADLLGTALSEVDWFEIAKHILSE